MIKRYRQALEVDPANLALHYYLGVALLVENRPAEAVREFRRAYPAFADSIEMNYNLGLALTRVGDADSAQLYLEQAETLGAMDSEQIYPLPSAYYNIGLLYLEAGRTREALRIFKKVLGLAPDRVDIHRLLGEIYAREGRDDEATEAFKTYLENYPGDAEVREYLFAITFNRALKALDRDRLEDARRGFEKALQISPGSPVATYYLGLIAYRQEQWGETVRRLSGPYADYPEDLRRAARSLLYNAALALQKAGQPDLAARAVASLLERHPNDNKVLYLAGNIHLDLEDFTTARRYFERLLDLEPGHSGATLNLVAARNGAVDDLIAMGQKHFRRDEYLQAAKFFREALAINPADPTARAYDAEIELELDKAFGQYLEEARSALAGEMFPQAVDAAMAALDLRPESSEGRQVLEKVRAAASQEFGRRLKSARNALRNGDLGAAHDGFSGALALDPQSAQARQGLEDVRAVRREKASSLAADGRAFLDQGKLNEARQAFDSSLALVPDFLEAREGRRQLEALVASMFAEEVSWARRAVSEGRLDVAERHYRKALELKDDPAVRAETLELEKRKRRHLEGLLAAARQAQADGDYRQAKNRVRKALEASPESAQAKQLLAELSASAAEAIRSLLGSATEALENGEPGLALARYRKVLDLDPANETALAGLESGRQALTAEVERLVSQATEALSEERLAEAQSFVRQALALDPYSATVKDVSKRVAAAEKSRQRALEGADVDTLYLEGIQLYTRGLYPEAVEAWEKVLAVDSDHEKARRNIEKARRKLERIRERQNG
ncbi:MAG: tetratricopeptide repeat protein [Desulfuromonadales bacterium]|nr:tetratricopeptide repeat protein [Desulfuromonadales bacterium]NIS42750.1 tetratricopeptide repeat protein [Desulfuromonadales bacterium]